MKLDQIALVVIISAVVSYGVSVYGPKSGLTQETDYQRIMRTNVLHCGYYIFPPFMMRDPNTGKMSGFTVDMMDYLTKKTGVKVEWTEEISFGTWTTALQAKRFDAVCAPIWADASFFRAAKFTESIGYASIDPFVRADDNRFDHATVASFNSPDITIATQEGNVTDALAHELFPKAKFDALPQNSDYPTAIQNVVAHKADMVMWDRNGFYQYSKNNPGKIKVVHLNQPLKIIPFQLAIAEDNGDLRDFLNGTIEDMQNTGEMDRLFDKWQDSPETYLRVAKPYR